MHRRASPGHEAGALVLLYGLGAMVLVLAAFLFHRELLALLEWVSSPEPWWRG